MHLNCFGYIEVFPAIPVSWQDVSFRNLRAEGGFLISAEKKDGEYQYVEIKAEKEGQIRLKLPDGLQMKGGSNLVNQEKGWWLIKLKAGDKIRLES
jgi:alpha-L-fucosidase 2